MRDTRLVDAHVAVNQHSMSTRKSAIIISRGQPIIRHTSEVKKALVEKFLHRKQNLYKGKNGIKLFLKSDDSSPYLSFCERDLRKFRKWLKGRKELEVKFISNTFPIAEIEVENAFADDDDVSTLSSPEFYFCENCMRCSFSDVDDDLVNEGSESHSNTSGATNKCIVNWTPMFSVGSHQEKHKANALGVRLPFYWLDVEKIVKRPKFSYRAKFCFIDPVTPKDMQGHKKYMWVCKCCRIYITGRYSSRDEYCISRERNVSEDTLHRRWRDGNTFYEEWLKVHKKDIQKTRDNERNWWPAYMWMILSNDNVLKVNADMVWKLLPMRLRCFWHESLMRRKAWIHNPGASTAKLRDDMKAKRSKKYREFLKDCLIGSCHTFKDQGNDSDRFFSIKYSLFHHDSSLQPSYAGTPISSGNAEDLIDNSVKKIMSIVAEHYLNLKGHAARNDPNGYPSYSTDFNLETYMNANKEAGNSYNYYDSKVYTPLPININDPYFAMSYECPAPFFADGSTIYLDSAIARDMNTSHSLLHFLNNHAYLCNIKCPFGCSDFVFNIGLVPFISVFRRFLNPVVLDHHFSVPRSEGVLFDVLEGARDDYLLRQSNFLPLKKGMQQWSDPRQDINRYFIWTDDGVSIATCQRHHKGCRKRYVHPPINPLTSTLTSPLSPQLSQCVVRPKVVKKMKRHTYTTTYDVRYISGGFKGISSCDLNTHGNFDLGSPIHDANMLLAINFRPDMRQLMNRMVQKGYMESFHYHNLIRAGQRLFSDSGGTASQFSGSNIEKLRLMYSTDIDDALVGATFISFQDSIILDFIMSKKHNSLDTIRKSNVSKLIMLHTTLYVYSHLYFIFPGKGMFNDPITPTQTPSATIVTSREHASNDTNSPPVTKEFTPIWPPSFIFVHPVNPHGSPPNGYKKIRCKNHLLDSLVLCVANVQEVYECFFKSVSDERHYAGWVLKLVHEMILSPCRQSKSSDKPPYADWNRLFLYISGNKKRTTDLGTAIISLMRNQVHSPMDDLHRAFSPIQHLEVGPFLAHSLRELHLRDPNLLVVHKVDAGVRRADTISSLNVSPLCEILVLYRSSSGQHPVGTIDEPLFFSELEVMNMTFKARFVTTSNRNLNNQNPYCFSYVRHREEEFSQWWCFDGDGKRCRMKPFHAKDRMLVDYPPQDTMFSIAEDFNLPSDVLLLWDIIILTRVSSMREKIHCDAFSGMGGHINLVCAKCQMPLVETMKESKDICSFAEGCSGNAFFECIWCLKSFICKKHLTESLRNSRGGKIEVATIDATNHEGSRQCEESGNNDALDLEGLDDQILGATLDQPGESLGDSGDIYSDHENDDFFGHEDSDDTSVFRCPKDVSIMDGRIAEDVFRVDGWQQVPSHDPSVLDRIDDIPDNLEVPTTMCKTDRTGSTYQRGKKFIGVHTFINIKGLCLMRRNSDLPMTRHERSTLQEIVSTSGDACPLSFPEAMLFPDLFWKSNSDGSIVGSLTANLWTDKKRTNLVNIASFHEHLLQRLTNPDLGMAGNRRYAFFGYDVLQNINLRGKTVRQVLSRGLREINHGMSIMYAGGSCKNNVRVCDFVDGRRAVNCLASMIRDRMPTHFDTCTLNEKDFPGMTVLYQMKEAFFLTLDHDPGMSTELKQELKMSVEQLASVQMTRSWQVTIEMIIKYLTKSSDEILGHFEGYFARLEHQESELKPSGTQCHLHLIAWTDHDMGDEQSRFDMYQRVRCSSRSMYCTDDIQQLIDMGIIATAADAHELRKKTRVLQVHDCKRCGFRCMKKLPNGLTICRYTDYYAENKARVYGFIVIDLKHCDKATAILCELDFMKRLPDGTVEVIDERFLAGKHVYPADPNERFTPTNPILFALTKSDCNVIVCGRYMVTRYLAKYVALIDDVSCISGMIRAHGLFNNDSHFKSLLKVARVDMRCVASEGTDGDLELSIVPLHNTKITSSKLSAKRELKSSRRRGKPHGRIMGLPQCLGEIFSSQTVFCSAKFVNISTVSLEHRPGIMTVKRLRKYRENDDDFGESFVDGNSANHQRLQNAPCDPIRGTVVTFSVPPSIEVRKKFEVSQPWRQFTPAQQRHIIDNCNVNVNVDTVTMFSVRPPELFFVNNYVDYLLFFAPAENENNFKTSSFDEDVWRSQWIDGLDKRILVRRSALQSIVLKYSSQMINFNSTMKQDKSRGMDIFLLFHSLLFIKNGGFSNEHEALLSSIQLGTLSFRKRIQAFKGNVNCRLYFDMTYNDPFPPLPLYNIVKPSNANKFFVHILLTMGSFNTEYELWDVANIRDAFVNAGLLSSNHETKADVYEQFKSVARDYIASQLLYVPSGTRMFDYYTKAAYRNLQYIYDNGAIPPYTVPANLHSYLEKQISDEVTEMRNGVRSNMIDAVRALIHHLPTKDEFLNASLSNPLPLDRIQYTSLPHQSQDSIEEQTEAFKAICATVDAFRDGRISDNNNWLLHGAPGTGKTHMAMLCVAYAIGQGLNFMSMALICERAIFLGGIHYHMVLSLGHVNDVSHIHTIAESSVERLMRNPPMTCLLRSLDGIFFDELGQMSAEEISILDIVLRQVRQSEAYMGGIMIIGALDLEQLGSIQGVPFLMSANIITSYQIIDFQHYVRCGSCPFAQRICELCRVDGFTTELKNEFINLITTHCKFVNDMNDGTIPRTAMRVLGLRRGVADAEKAFVRSLREQRVAVRQAVAHDTEKGRSSTSILKPASRPTISALNKSATIREPEILHLYEGAVMEMTHNNRPKWSQGQLCVCPDIPDQEDLDPGDENAQLTVYLAPPGTKTVPSENILKSAMELRNLGWTEITLKKRSEHNKVTIGGGIFAERKQFPLRSRIAATTHRAMGSNVKEIVTEVSRDKNSRGYLWDHGQIVVLLSRTPELRSIYFITRNGSKSPKDIAGDLIFILEKKPQYYAHMRHIISRKAFRFRPKHTTDNNSAEIHVPSVITLDSHPFRPMDIALPDDGITLGGYTYILLSLADMSSVYIGSCKDIVARYNIHNHSHQTHTQKIAPPSLRPWALIAFLFGFKSDNARQQVERSWQFLCREELVKNALTSPLHLVDIGRLIASRKNLTFQECAKLSYVRD